jgi:hypothetical protein
VSDRKQRPDKSYDQERGRLAPKPPAKPSPSTGQGGSNSSGNSGGQSKGNK